MQRSYEGLAKNFPWYSESHVLADRPDISKKYKDVHTACQRIVTKHPLSLLVIGQFGTGKTHILHAIMRHLSRLLWPEFEMRFPVKAKAGTSDTIRTFAFCMMEEVALITHHELVRMLRSSVGQEQDVYFDRAIRETPAGHQIVLLDDLGWGYDDKGGFNLSLLNEYFDWRWRRRLATIVTSNKTLKELNEWEGWERIVDRFADEEWMKVVPLTGRSKRRS